MHVTEKRAMFSYGSAFFLRTVCHPLYLGSNMWQIWCVFGFGVFRFLGVYLCVLVVKHYGTAHFFDSM